MGIRFIEYDSVGDFYEKAKEVTAACRKKAESEPKKEVNELSPYAKGVLSVWSRSDFGCQTAHVGEFFRLTVKQVTGEDVEFNSKRSPIENEDHSYPVWSVIVPLSISNGADYEIGKPLFVTKKNSSKPFNATHCVKYTVGVRGNYFGGEWRYATDEEVEDYFTSFNKTVKGEPRKISISESIIKIFIDNLTS